MKEVQEQDTPVSNIYPDEQEKLERDFELELEFTFKLIDLLDQYGFSLEAILDKGKPKIEVVKQDKETT